MKTIDASRAASGGAPLRAAMAAKSASPPAAMAAASATSRRWWARYGGSLEAIGFWALILVYMWWVERRVSIVMNVLCLLVLGAIPIASMVLHRQRASQIGLRLDNLGRSAREVGITTLAASAVIVACGIAGGGAPRLRADLILTVPVYLVWGLLQQLALQAFVLRRLSGAVPGPRSAALLSATLFASLHLPNPVLAPATLVAGYCWCRLYARAPNLITLACSHAVLAILTLLSFPPAWIHQLRVGPRYWLNG